MLCLVMTVPLAPWEVAQNLRGGTGKDGLVHGKGTGLVRRGVWSRRLWKVI